MGSVLKGESRQLPDKNFQIDQQNQRYKKSSEDYYTDSYESDKKRSHQNYSNMFGQKLGEPEERSQHSETQDNKNTLELNKIERSEPEKQNHNYQGNLIPSVHYSEYQNSNFHKEQTQKTNQELMEERTQKMMNSLRETSNKRVSENPNQIENGSSHSQNSRNYYKTMMGHGKNTINNTEDQNVFGQMPNEHLGEIVVRLYKVQGYKYDLINYSEKQLRAEFLKNGYHVINLEIVKDPISGDANGMVIFRVRLQAQHERSFEHFFQTQFKFVIMSKK